MASACAGALPPPPPEPEGTDAGADAGEPADAGVEAPGPLLLAPGEVAELAATGVTFGVRLATPKGDETFVVILASTHLESPKTRVGYSVALAAMPDAPRAQLVSGCAISSEPWRSTALPIETPPSGTAVSVGTTRAIKVPTPSGTVSIQAEAIAVGSSAVVWADTTPQHPANLDGGFVSQFLSDFETTILPRERTVFGMESDVDHDGRISLVFSPLTHQTAVAFFSGCDLMSVAACPDSNQGEYLYLTPPAAIAPPYNTPNAIKEILSHECSHLVHFNRKVLRNHLIHGPDSAYLHEGIGGFAQDAVGPQAGNLYVAKAGLDGIEKFSLADTLGSVAQYDTARDGVLRGGSYLLVRYLYDRAGGDLANPDGTLTSRGGPVMLRALLDAPQAVAVALATVTGAPLGDIATDFYTALAMSNRDEGGGVAPTNPCFTYLPVTTDPIWNKQRGANLFAQFGMQMTGPAMQKATAPDGEIRLGGVEFLELAANPGHPSLELSVAVDATARPRVRVGRLR